MIAGFHKTEGGRVNSRVLAVIVDHDLIIVTWKVIGGWVPNIRAVVQDRICGYLVLLTHVANNISEGSKDNADLR